MDIITHTLSGVVISAAAAALTKKPLWEKGIIICCGAIGGAFPDIDVITLWSGFDTTIGTFFDLSRTGRDIYFSNYWYSHHHLTHSLAGGAMITMSALLLLYLANLVLSKNRNPFSLLRGQGVYGLAFFLGYVMHLFGDLPTPGHTWKGITLFWPLSTAIGGTGHIWWWNNYDIFLLISGCCSVNIVVVMLQHIFKKPFIRYFPVIFSVVVSLAVLHQIIQRPVSFAYTGYNKKYNDHGNKSLEIQQEILGKRVYEIMVAFDRKLPIHF